jgi:hypothetical protein
MSTKQRIEELQASYQSLVDSVENFVVKEGKTLQEAFHAAEEKLDEAKGASKDKIQQASKELKSNLRLLAEAVEGASEAYKEQIKFDLAYVNSSIWSKVQSIANSNTVELIEFTNSLKESAQDATTDEHIAAHQEHNQWDSDHGLWLAELKSWEKGQEQGLTKLAQIEKILKRQSSSLREHAQRVQALARVGYEHEKVMTNAEKDPSSQVFKEADDKEIEVHRQQREDHAQQAELHHQLKINHFKTMAMINMLYKEANKAE